MKNKIQFKKDMHQLMRALGYLKKYKLKIVVLFATIAITMMINIIQPMVMGKIIEDITYKSFDILKGSLIILILLSIAGCVVSYGKRYLTELIRNYFAMDLKIEMHKKILNFSMGVFDSTKVGEFLSRMDNDVGRVVYTITGQLLNFTVTLVRMLVLLTIIIRINWRLSMVTIAMFPILFYTFRAFGRILRKKSREIALINDEYYTVLQQSLNEVKYIKSLGLKEESTGSFKRVITRLKSKQMDITSLSILSNNLLMFTSSLNDVLIIAIGIQFVIGGSLSVQYLFAFSTYAADFSIQIGSLTSINSDLQQLAVSLERIFKIIDNDGFEAEIFGNQEIKDEIRDITFEDVDFSYDKDRKILKDLSLNIPGRGLTVITGKNGCGKSTILNIISGLYKVDDGKVIIGEKNIEDISEVSLRKNIYLIHQQNYLFNRSIMENFRMVNSDVTQAEVEAACARVDMDNYIKSLDQGYDTIINENVSNLSGGQRQRLVLAMCIVKDTQIVLLDEVTSALDRDSRSIIEKVILELSERKGVIAISHDDEIIERANNIVYFRDDGIVEVSHNGQKNYSSAY